MTWELGLITVLVFTFGRKLVFTRVFGQPQNSFRLLNYIQMFIDGYLGICVSPTTFTLLEWNWENFDFFLNNRGKVPTLLV